MSDGEWAYTDDDGNKLILAPCHDADLAGGHYVHADVAADGPVCIAPGDWPRIIAAACKAAGKPEPVILERPVPAALGCYSDGVRVFADGNRVRLQATESHSAKEYWRARLKPADARKLAACIAALADAVEDEPDPAEVEELTGVLVQAGAGLRSTGVDDIARAALRWADGRRQQGVTP